MRFPFTTLTSSTDNEFNGFETSILRMFRHSVGDFAFDIVGANEANDGLTTAMLVGWTLCGTVVLLNLLIALMSGTYKEISGDATRIWQLQRARMITMMEGRFGTSPIHRSWLNIFRAPAKLIKFVGSLWRTGQAEKVVPAKNTLKVRARLRGPFFGGGPYLGRPFFWGLPPPAGPRPRPALTGEGPSS